MPLFLLTTSLLSIACGSNDASVADSGVTVDPGKHVPLVTGVRGVAQKGPFALGSAVNLYELETDLSPTGRVFTTEILDHTGRFEFPKLRLNSPYVLLSADGFYFDEVLGQLSSAPLHLYSLARLTAPQDPDAGAQAAHGALNINLLTHLERTRVETLVAGGESFESAKALARRQLLAVFGFAEGEAPSEELDLSQSGTENAVLLAITTMLQAHRTVGELTEFLSRLGMDMREDGTLDDPAVGSAIVNGATYIDLAQVRENLEQRYRDIGAAAEIPKFEPLVRTFLDSTPFPLTDVIEYPDKCPVDFANAWRPGKPNLLAREPSTDPELSDAGTSAIADGGAQKQQVQMLEVGALYGMCAKLPRGSSLRIVHRGTQGGSCHPVMVISPGSGFTYGEHDDGVENGEACFMSYLANPDQDGNAMGPWTRPPSSDGSADFELYENGAENPTRSIKMVWLPE